MKQWLFDVLRGIPASGEIERLAEGVPDSAGVPFVPAFTGPPNRAQVGAQQTSACADNPQ